MAKKKETFQDFCGSVPEFLKKSLTTARSVNESLPEFSQSGHDSGFRNKHGVGRHA